MRCISLPRTHPYKFKMAGWKFFLIGFSVNDGNMCDCFHKCSKCVRVCVLGQSRKWT